MWNFQTTVKIYGRNCLHQSIRINGTILLLWCSTFFWRETSDIRNIEVTVLFPRPSYCGHVQRDWSIILLVRSFLWLWTLPQRTLGPSVGSECTFRKHSNFTIGSFFNFVVIVFGTFHMTLWRKWNLHERKNFYL